jgi:uncharacterized protein (TIGR03435 family)
MRSIFVTIALTLMVVRPSLSQDGSPTIVSLAKTPTFDVISVKPNNSGGATMFRMTPDGFTMVNMPLDLLLTRGFQVDPNQIIGEPGWAKSDRWDVDAKVAGEDVAALAKMTFDPRQAMFQQVLTDRFGMKFHRETRELPVYALVVAKGGPKIKGSKPDPDAPDEGKRNPPRMTSGSRDGDISGQNVTTELLASVLSRYVDRTVVDKTGLTGTYDFAISSAGGTDTLGPSIFTTVQEQLGLKLEPTKGPVDVIVIDHIEKPIPN